MLGGDGWSLRAFARTPSIAIFLRAPASRDKKFAFRAASSLESTTREQWTLLIFSACSNPYGNPFLQNRTENIFKRGFNLERIKFFEASLSDTLSRSNQLQSLLMLNDEQEEQPYITTMYNHI